ncbi:MAG TPA: extracellular solute-binding protein, partial [Terriglobales bacterium]|nr:extracellular solute-binding protein [Terriglobales bacterium]
SQEAVESTLARLNALSPTERQSSLVKGAQSEKLVEWYATLPLELSSQLIMAFRKRYPFIEVKYTRGGGGRTVNRVLTEHRAGSDKFDVLGGTSTSQDILMKAGLIARNLTPLRKELRDGFTDAEGYRVMPFTYAMVIGYNTRAVPKEQRPRSYEDLLQAKWKGEIGLETASYEWLAALIDTMGEDKALVFARKLATQGLRMQPSSSMLVQQMSAGEFKVLIDALHYQIENQKQQGAPVDYVIPDPLLIKDPSALWLAKYAPHPHAAALLIDFLLSREAQQMFVQANRLVARKDLDWRSLGKLPERSHVLSAEKWAPRDKELISLFDKIFR